MVVSDSMAKHTKIRKGEVQAYSGDTIRRLTERLSRGEVGVRGYSRIIVHVGTNDLSNMMRRKNFRTVTIYSIISAYKGLLEAIRRLNPNALVIFSSILPRTKGYRIMKPYVRGANFALEKLCAQSQGTCVFLPSFRWFLKEGRPVAEYFSKKDGLHLRGKGIVRLADCFTQGFATGYLLKRLAKARTRKLASLRF